MALDVIESGLLTPANDNPYHKIHFYFDDQAHATIDSAAELAAATASVKGDNAVATMAVEEEENVYITVCIFTIPQVKWLLYPVVWKVPLKKYNIQ